MTSPAFAASAPALSFASSFTVSSVCPSRPASTNVPRRRCSLRMEVASSSTEVTPAVDAPQSPSAPPAWPPAGMTAEWAEAVDRLASSVPSGTLSGADQALSEANGDEMLALRLLTEDSPSDIQRQREAAVEKARAGGDVNRVSAIKEAELRRRATGSAKDFFKGYVEVEAKYVDQGYVDESADAMGKLADTIKGWFGRK